MKKFLIVSVIVLAITSVLIPVLLYAKIWDIAEPTPPAQLVTYISPDDPRNACREMIELVENRYDEFNHNILDEILGSPKAKFNPVAAREFIQQHHDLYDLIDKILAKEVISIAPKSEKESFVFGFRMMQVNKLLKLQILLAQEEKRYDDCFLFWQKELAFIIKCFEADRYRQLSMLIEAGRLSSALDDVLRVFPHFSSEQIRTIMTQINDFPSIVAFFKKSTRSTLESPNFLNELLNDMDDKEKNVLKWGFLYQPNRGRKLCYDRFVLMNQYIESEDLFSAEAKFRKVLNEEHDQHKSFPFFNYGGYLIYDRLAPHFIGVEPEDVYTPIAKLRGTQIVLALELYRRQHGNYPQELQQLVPEFLSEVLLDPFDGKPFRFRLAERRIYSVGEKRLDAFDPGVAESLNRREKRRAMYSLIFFYLDPHENSEFYPPAKEEPVAEDIASDTSGQEELTENERTFPKNTGI